MKKLLSTLLCVMLVACMMPTMAFADDTSPDMSGSIIYVTSANAQDVLDGVYGDISDKTIKFTEDIETVLDLARPTKYEGSRSVYVPYNGDGTYAEKTTDASLVKREESKYYRTLSNVIFTAEEGISIAGFSFTTGHKINEHDYVREAEGKYYDYRNLENITFSGLTITGNVEFASYMNETTVKNISFENCEFTGTTADTTSDAAIGMSADSVYYTDISVTNCTIGGYFQGVYIQGIDGATIKNNTIKNTEHNAIALQSSVSNTTRGTVSVMENYIDGSKDRAIRLNEVDSSASISINNNIIEDCGDENGELIKAGSTNGASIDIENNYWDNETELGKVIVGLDKPSSTGITGGTFPALDDISKYLAADTNIVAKVGETYCSTLKEAVAVGGTITVLDNIELTETLVIPVNTTVTLDLNGKTVSGITDNTGATAVIENKGTLTIQDSSEEGTGKITSAVSNPDTTMDPYPSFANNTVNNRGDLVVESGTIENTTVGGACYAIDNYSGGSVTVNGGTVEGKANFAIRMFVNSTDANNAVTVNGGIVKGTRAIWIHLAGSDSSVTPKAEVNVTGGTLESNESEYNLAIYSYSYGNSFAETNVKITGGTFNGDVAFGGGYKGDTETVTISGGTFTGSYGVYSYGDMAPFITGGVYSADVTKYVVKDINTYVMNDNYYVGEASKPAAPSGKVWADDDKDGVYELKTVSTPSTGGGYVSIEKPSITVDDGATADLSIPGTTLKITVKDGYELVDVTLNGISKGAVSELKGLKTGDKVVIITKAIDETTVTDPEVELIARSEMSKAKGKKAIKVYWFAEDGSELTYDGYEIFRSVKRYSGYGKKPIFETEREAYWNTDIEEGTKYFYKVRGYNFIDGEKEYSDWSKKAWRTVE